MILPLAVFVLRVTNHRKHFNSNYLRYHTDNNRDSKPSTIHSESDSKQSNRSTQRHEEEYVDFRGHSRNNPSKVIRRDLSVRRHDALVDTIRWVMLQTVVQAQPLLMAFRPTRVDERIFRENRTTFREDFLNVILPSMGAGQMSSAQGQIQRVMVEYDSTRRSLEQRSGDITFLTQTMANLGLSVTASMEQERRM
jgi:hypothetical protein